MPNLFPASNHKFKELSLQIRMPELVEELRAGMRTWQESVLNSLMGNDYR